MTEPKLTPWFHGVLKPVRPGVYQRQWDEGNTWYARWDGSFWHMSVDSPRRAFGALRAISPQQQLPWRGLAKQPK